MAESDSDSVPCYQPLHGWRAKTVNPSGRRSIVFDRGAALVDMPVQLPCGQCIGCRLEYSRQWAIRCLHEASLHEDSIFLTLTYDDDHLPIDGSLTHRHYQLFAKRLRKHLPFRYYMCGEYGENYGRPHYHALLFGLRFPDAERSTWSDDVMVSETCNKLWGKGACGIGEVSFESAAYVARYTVKKVTGERAASHYESLNPLTGEIHSIAPEYCQASRRPGIGTGYYQRYKEETYRTDRVVVRGREMLPPKFYDELLRRDDEVQHAALKRNREELARANPHNSTQRLIEREKVTTARTKLKTRTLT